MFFACKSLAFADKCEKLGKSHLNLLKFELRDRQCCVIVGDIYVLLFFHIISILLSEYNQFVRCCQRVHEVLLALSQQHGIHELRLCLLRRCMLFVHLQSRTCSLASCVTMQCTPIYFTTRISRNTSILTS